MGASSQALVAHGLVVTLVTIALGYGLISGSKHSDVKSVLTRPVLQHHTATTYPTVRSKHSGLSKNTTKQSKPEKRNSSEILVVSSKFTENLRHHNEKPTLRPESSKNLKDVPIFRQKISRSFHDTSSLAHNFRKEKVTHNPTISTLAQNLGNTISNQYKIKVNQHISNSDQNDSSRLQNLQKKLETTDLKRNHSRHTPNKKINEGTETQAKPSNNSSKKRSEYHTTKRKTYKNNSKVELEHRKLKDNSKKIKFSGKSEQHKPRYSSQLQKSKEDSDHLDTRPQLRPKETKLSSKRHPVNDNSEIPGTSERNLVKIKPDTHKTTLQPSEQIRIEVQPEAIQTRRPRSQYASKDGSELYKTRQQSELGQIKGRSESRKNRRRTAEFHRLRAHPELQKPSEQQQANKSIQQSDPSRSLGQQSGPIRSLGQQSTTARSLQLQSDLARSLGQRSVSSRRLDRRRESASWTRPNRKRGRMRHTQKQVLVSFHQMDPPTFFNPGWTYGTPSHVTWWQGPHVCRSTEKETFQAPTGRHQDRQQDTQQDKEHLSTTSQMCHDLDTIYKCTVVEETIFGRREFSVVHACCHGYTRRKGNFGCPHKVRLLTVQEKAQDLGLTDFVQLVTHLNLGDFFGKDNITVLFPINGAFEQDSTKSMRSINVLLRDVRETLNTLPESATWMTSRTLSSLRTSILAHLVPGALTTADMKDEQLLPTIWGPQTLVRVNFFSRPTNMMTANCVPVVSRDNVAANGVIHSVEKFLTPVSRNILELVKMLPELSTLLTVFRAGDYLSLLEQRGPLTLWAPTNAAFDRMDQPTKRKILWGDRRCLKRILAHLQPHVVCSVAVQGQARTENHLKEFLSLRRTTDNQVFVNNAQVVRPDVMATNGVIHVIDRVLFAEHDICS